MNITLLDPLKENLLVDDAILFDSENILNYLRDPFTSIAWAVKDEEVIAIGLIRIVNEFKAVFNPNMSNYKKAKALNELFKNAIDYIKYHGSNEIYALVTQGGKHFEDILEHKYGFYKPAGTLMKLEV